MTIWELREQAALKRKLLLRDRAHQKQKAAEEMKKNNPVIQQFTPSNINLIYNTDQMQCVKVIRLENLNNPKIQKILQESALK